MNSNWCFHTGGDPAQSGEGWDTWADSQLPAEHCKRRQDKSWRCWWGPETLLPRRHLHLPAESCPVPGTWGERPVARSSSRCIFCRSLSPVRLWFCRCPHQNWRLLLQLSALQKVHSSDAEAEVQAQTACRSLHWKQFWSFRPSSSWAGALRSSPAGSRTKPAGDPGGETGDQTEPGPEPAHQPDFVEALALISRHWPLKLNFYWLKKMTNNLSYPSHCSLKNVAVVILQTTA